MKANRILVNNGVRKRIKDALNCSYPTVRTALKGKADTPLALQIRKVALEMGGVEVEELTPKK